MTGIINVQWFDNPGAVLLCYALEQTVNKIVDDDVIVIDYAAGGGKSSNIIEKICKIPHKVKSKLLHNKYISGVRYSELLVRRHELFEKFRKENLNRTMRFNELNSPVLKENYSHCIVGSDVVWKPEIADSSHAHVYFLNFGQDSMKRISYGASIGTEDLTVLKPLLKKYEKHLQNFDYISVREHSAAEFIKDLAPVTVKKVADPVFLLKREEYDKLADSVERITKEKYIFAYLLSYNESAVAKVKRIAEEKKCKIVYDLHTDENFKLIKAFGKDAIPMVDVGPLEFLSAIKNAECIINNSFHGTAFSLIFEKDFYTFGKVNKGIDISTRMSDLLDYLQLSGRYCKEEKIRTDSIDYNKVNEKITIMREDSLEFLKEALK